MAPTDSKRPVRVAIVGSGMAGLVTAYLLHQDPQRRYAVKLLESGDSLSLDSASVSIPNASHTSSSRIDLPMRAFAGGYYNNLKAMYDHLQVKYHRQPFLFEFAKVRHGCERRGRDGDTSYFIHASNLHKMPPPRPNAMATLSYLVEVIYLLACYTWFSACCFLVAPRMIPQGSYGRTSETVEQYMKRVRLPEYFVTYYVLPLISSVTTCPHKSLLSFPASDLTEYKRRTHGAPHYTVSNGVGTVQTKLAKGIDYELNAVVTAVRPEGKGVRVSWKQSSQGMQSTHDDRFDRVVLAVAPDIVGRIFEPLRGSLSKIPTTMVESVVHTDRSALDVGEAQDKSSSAQLIYLRTSTYGAKETESLHVQPCGAIVSTCPFSPINPSLIIHSARFTRVLRSPESRQVVNSIFRDAPSLEETEKQPLWRNGDDEVWLVGGWCWDGMVLLEGCVVSAIRVADAFGVRVPWK